jgi:hypothetical protein
MIDSARYNLYANDPVQFRADLLVDVSGSVQRLNDVMDPWQRADFAALDYGAQRCNGRTTKFKLNRKMRAYLERGRGHSKTTDLAILSSWILAFATRPVKGHIFAADKDQAGLLKSAVETVIRLNPWLARLLTVQKSEVINIAKGHPAEGSTLIVGSSDVSSSYGLLSDFLLVDELTHHQGDGSLWHSIISTAAKRKNCFVGVIANAGFVDSWQWSVRETARTSNDWYFSRLDGPVASWLTEKTLAEQRSMLPAIAYRRLWLNEWSTGGGDALTTEDIEAAFRDDLEPMSGNESGYYFVGGSDLGLTRDCAAFVVLAVPIGGKSGKIKLAHHKLWQPMPGRKINLLEVVRHILDCDRKFKLQFIGFDPWQHEMMAQTLEADSNRKRRNSRRVFFAQPFMREIPPTPTNLRQQASLTIESFQDHRFQMYTCEPLRRDLHKLRVEEKNNSFRLVSPRDGHGHGDTASAFCLALLIAHELAGKKRVVLGGQKDNSYLTAIEKRMEADRREEEHLASKGKQDPSGLLEAMSNGQVNVVSQFRF